MKRFSYLYLLGFILLLAPAGYAQSSISNRISVGVYGNYFRLSDGQLDLAGVGGRVSVSIVRRVQFEAESGYNFEEAFSQGYNDSSGAVVLTRTQVRTLDGLFGPKFDINKGRIRFFATVKGGFMNFNLETSPAVTIQTVATSFKGLNGLNTFGVFYPGGGAEAFWGHFGVRVDVGDEMYFNSGTHNNLRVSFGPTIRF